MVLLLYSLIAIVDITPRFDRRIGNMNVSPFALRSPANSFA
jgi:hypothetical protein